MDASRLISIALVALPLAACSPGAPSADAQRTVSTAAPARGEQSTTASNEASHAHASQPTLTLSADEQQRLGIVTTVAQSVSYSPGAEGIGTVLTHDAFAQAVAEVQTAEATARASEAALARGKRLLGTPGAWSADVLDAAQRQAAADRAAQALAERKLALTVGDRYRWPRDAQRLAELAAGSVHLARITFAPGALSGVPRQLWITDLDAAAASPGESSRDVWPAPQDPSVPGRSWFALLPDDAAPEGARLAAAAVTQVTVSGDWIPESAVVMSSGASWCYRQVKPGTYERIAIDLAHPLGAGYVEPMLSAGDAIVTTSAALLLAKESASADDDDSASGG